MVLLEFLCLCASAGRDGWLHPRQQTQRHTLQSGSKPYGASGAEAGARDKQHPRAVPCPWPEEALPFHSPPGVLTVAPSQAVACPSSKRLPLDHAGTYGSKCMTVTTLFPLALLGGPFSCIHNAILKLFARICRESQVPWPLED